MLSKPLKLPEFGWVTTMPILLRMTPPPTGTSEVLTRAPDGTLGAVWLGDGLSPPVDPVPSPSVPSPVEPPGLGSEAWLVSSGDVGGSEAVGEAEGDVTSSGVADPLDFGPGAAT